MCVSSHNNHCDRFLWRDCWPVFTLNHYQATSSIQNKCHLGGSWGEILFFQVAVLKKGIFPCASSVCQFLCIHTTHISRKHTKEVLWPFLQKSTPMPNELSCWSSHDQKEKEPGFKSGHAWLQVSCLPYPWGLITCTVLSSLGVSMPNPLHLTFLRNNLEGRESHLLHIWEQHIWVHKANKLAENRTVTLPFGIPGLLCIYKIEIRSPTCWFHKPTIIIHSEMGTVRDMMCKISDPCFGRWCQAGRVLCCTLFCFVFNSYLQKL